MPETPDLARRAERRPGRHRAPQHAAERVERASEVTVLRGRHCAAQESVATVITAALPARHRAAYSLAE
jgi:hypothetical protein